MCISFVLISLIDSPKRQNQGTKQRHDDSKLPSNPEEVEDLRRDSAANPLIAFTYDELKIITANFRQDRVLGGGGFGRVYKGFISEELREGLPTLAVAVKVHDGDNSHQGHREWLVHSLSFCTFFLDEKFFLWKRLQDLRGCTGIFYKEDPDSISTKNTPLVGEIYMCSIFRDCQVSLQSLYVHCFV